MLKGKGKLFVTCMVLAAVFAASYFYQHEDAVPLRTEVASNPTDNSELQSDDHSVFVEKTSPVGSKDDFDVKQVSQASTSSVSTFDNLPVAWKVAAANTPYPSNTLHESIADYELIEVNSATTKIPAMGEKIKLPLLDGKFVVATVTSTTTNFNGDASWTGYLEGYGDAYPIIMTYGRDSVFATITTPEGSFSLESIKGVGWLYKNPSEFELSEPNSTDQLIPPISQ